VDGLTRAYIGQSGGTGPSIGHRGGGVVYDSLSQGLGNTNGGERT
jgi:hypothetical protein